jgi:hypothetical protein
VADVEDPGAQLDRRVARRREDVGLVALLERALAAGSEPSPGLAELVAEGSPFPAGDDRHGLSVPWPLDEFARIARHRTSVPAIRS